MKPPDHPPPSRDQSSMNPPGVEEGNMDPSMQGGQHMGAGVAGGFPAVKLRGLPFDAQEDDLKMFLGCEPIDILMVHRDGRLSGEAFVVLSSPMQVELALSKNRSYMGRRYVEVFKTQKMDYYRAVAAELMDGQGGGFHGGYGGQGYGAGMGGPMGMYGGQGYGGPQAYGGGPRGYGGPRYGGGMGGGMGGSGGGAGGAGGAYAAGGDSSSTILKLRGLPFSVQDEDIVQWFADPSLGITPLTTDSVFIVQEGGRPNGIAFVEFSTPQEANAAMVKNRQMMGNRYIECFKANRADLERYGAKGGAY